MTAKKKCCWVIEMFLGYHNDIADHVGSGE